MKYELVDANHELLSQRIDDFDFNEPPIDAEELVKDMRGVLEGANAAGLAANQLGLPYRVCVINSAPALNMFNPSITYYNEDYAVGNEGCLSHPGLFIKIRRPSTIRVRYTDENGDVQTKKLDGAVSRVVQHEIDHLNGIDFTERASKINLDKAKKTQKQVMKKLRRIGR